MLSTGKRLLVTGGAGFIGSELVRQLSASGHHVTVVDNLATGKAENLEGLSPERVRFVKADIRDRVQMATLIPGTDIIYHLACLGCRHSIHSPLENHEVNAEATLRLLIEARRVGVSRFVHVSSSEVYGTGRYAPMNEDHPTFPMTVYGGGKLAGECYARAFHRTYDFPTVVVRPFNAYGPRSHHEGDCGEVIPKFILRCLNSQPLIVHGDGTQTRDFSFVEDIARGIFSAGFAPNAVGHTLNIGSGIETTINDLAHLTGDVCGMAAKVEHGASRPGDVLRLCAETSLAKQILGYEPRVSLREGMGRLLKWYKEQGKTPAELLASEVVCNWERPHEVAGVSDGR